MSRTLCRAIRGKVLLIKKITALHSTGARGSVSCAVNITNM